MAVKIELKRSAVPGRVPTTSSLELGEVAINTYDGRLFYKQDVTGSESIIEVATVSGSILSASYANNAGHANTATSASYALNSTSASYAFFATSASRALNSNNATSASYAINATSASYAQTSSFANDFTVAGTLTAQKLVVQTISSSIIYSSGSNVFGDELSDTHRFTGSVSITGSLSINGKDFINTSASFDSRILNNSSSIGLLSSSFLAFSGSYNTGSFTGSFSGSLNGTASFAATASNILGGSATYIPYFNTNTTLANSAMYQIGSASIAINEINITTANPEALYVFQTHPTSFNAITGKGNLNNYLQLNIQNTNQGVSASSDVVATANNGNEENMYINMGINSENFSGPLGEANDAYLYSVANNLHIGSAATGSQHLGLFVGGDDVDENNKITLRSNNLHELTGSLDVSGSLVVRYGITGNLNGTASYATLAEYALNAGLLDGYDSAAFLLTSSYNNFTASYLITSASFSSSISLLSSSFQSFSSSYTTGSFTGSFKGDGSGLTNISASNVVGLNLSQIASGSVTASIDPNLGFRVNTNSLISGSLSVTGSIYANSGITGSLFGTASWANNAITSSYALVATSASYSQTSSFASDFIVAGTLTAQKLVVQTISSSVVYSSGSNIFGDELSDTQTFTGSVNITGSLNINGSNYINTSASFDSRILANSSSINLLSGSYLTDSSSFNNRINIISSSYATTGSNIFKGNQTITGSLFTTGSNTLIGTTTLTGSFLVLGSTTQTGNNNLIGNTSLSGSIIISGSVAAEANFSVGGTLRLDPAQDPGSNNITASYLFTSASNTSTGYDLYYRQRDNLIKFKWIEGGLSSGLLYGGNITYSGSTIFVKKGSGVINNMNATAGSEINPILTYVNWNDYTASAQFLTSSQNTYLYVDASGSIFQQTSFFNQTLYEQAIPLGRVTHPNYVSITGAGSNVQTTYDNDTQQNDFIRAFGPIKVSGFEINAHTGSLSLGIGSGIAYNLGGFYTEDPNSPSHYESVGFATASIARAWRSGSGVYLDNNGGAFYNTVDPDYWDDGTGVLNTMNAGDWQIQRVFVNPSTGRTVVYYGQTGTYTNLLNALQYLATDPFTEGEFTSKSLVFAGYLVLRGQTNNLTDTTNNRIINAGIFRNIAGGSSGGGAVAQTLNDLSDVIITTPTNYQSLVYDSGNWINGIPLNATSASYALIATSASYALNATSASYAQTASFALNATSASYALNSTSASYAQTSSFANDFTVAGTITAQKLVVQTITSSVIYSSGSNVFGNSLSNTQQLTGSVSVTGSLAINDSLVILTNQTSSMSVLSASYANNSTSASYALNATTASYALEATSASYAFNSTSASQSENSNTANSSSYALNSTSASYALNSISASQSNNTNTAISASQANNANTAISASYALNATTSSYALNATSASYAFNSTSASYALTASYAMNGGGGGISAITMADEGVLQGTASYFDFVGEGVIVTVSNNTASINIPANIITGSTSFLDQTVPATTWSFAHNLNSKYVNFEVYNSSDFVIIPAGIKVVDQNNAEIYFSSNTTGKAVAQFSGIDGMSNALSASYATNALSASYATNALSASYAATSSHATNFTIESTLNFSGTLTDYASVNSSIVGSNNLFTQPTSSYTSAFFKYTVSNGGNARSGEIISVWNGTTVQFTDNSTADIGTTTPVTSSVAIVGGDLQFNMQTNTSGWKIKSISTFM
jgi:hypothetical protein